MVRQVPVPMLFPVFFFPSGLQADQRTYHQSLCLAARGQAGAIRPATKTLLEEPRADLAALLALQLALAGGQLTQARARAGADAGCCRQLPPPLLLLPGWWSSAASMPLIPSASPVDTRSCSLRRRPHACRSAASVCCAATCCPTCAASRPGAAPPPAPTPVSLASWGRGDCALELQSIAAACPPPNAGRSAHAFASATAPAAVSAAASWARAAEAGLVTLDASERLVFHDSKARLRGCSRRAGVRLEGRAARARGRRAPPWRPTSPHAALWS